MTWVDLKKNKLDDHIQHEGPRDISTNSSQVFLYVVKNFNSKIYNEKEVRNVRRRPESNLYI